MKYIQRFKGLLFFALACSFTAQGSTDETVTRKNSPSDNSGNTSGSITVTAGQIQNIKAADNLTISGKTIPLTVESEGRVTLTAGKTILLLPGTKVSPGGFLYASIEPAVKSGKHQKKEIRLVTVEEKIKIEEQASLSQAYTLFSPFPSRNRGHLHAGDTEQGSFSASNSKLFAVSPEQQRKVAVTSRSLPEVTRQQVILTFNLNPVAFTSRSVTHRVLRL